MSVNFDAQINLDVSKFIASVETAEKSIDSLQNKLTALSSARANIRVNTAQATQALSGLQKQINQVSTKTATVNVAAKATNAADAITSQTQRKQAASDYMREAAAKARVNAETDDSVRNLARERYALYDVAAAYTAISGIGVAALTQLTGATITYERAFADVARTTEFTSAKLGEAARVMYYDLMQIATEIPLAFSRITEIATIGNQLGVAQGKLSQFTETVAKFSATTGMTAEATAMGLGRSVELLSDAANPVSFEQLGSAIAFAGVNAVATEEQIVSVTKEIATTAKMANFSASEVVGLATALSSVGVAPEAARGSIIRTFAGINAAISKGGEELDAYAKIAGMSGSAFATSWKQNGQVAFDSFLKGLQSLSTGGANLDTVLRSIGLRNVRDIQTIQKLGDNYDVYAESIRNANAAYADGTYLTESYGKIQDTVATKLQLMKNNWDNLMASLGEGALGDSLKTFVDAINAMLTRLNELSRSPIGKFIGGLMIGLSAFAIVLGTVNGIMALTAATMRAFVTAGEGLVMKNGKAVTSVRLLDAALAKMNITANISTVALTRMRVAAAALGGTLKGIAVIAAISLIFEGLNAIGNAMKDARTRAEELIGGFGGLQDAVTADTVALKANAKEVGMTVEQYAAMTGVILASSVEVENNDASARKAAEAHNALSSVLGGTTQGYNNTLDPIGKQTLAIGENTKAWIRNSIAQNSLSVFQNREAAAALQQTGFNLNDALLRKQEGTLDKYLKTVKNKIAKNLAASSGDWVPLQNLPALGAAQSEIDKLGTIIGGTYDQMVLLGLGTEETSKVIEDGSGSLDQYGEDMDDLAVKIRTVVDYADDLRQVFDRAQDIRFGEQSALDQITLGWLEIAEAANEAREAVEDAEDQLKELRADKSTIEYQLSVAERYGDEKRAAQLRARLDKTNDKIADTEKDLADAVDEASQTLEGNSKAAIKNRAALQGMVDKYQDYTLALIEAGYKGKDLADKINGLSSDFIENAKKAGFVKDATKNVGSEATDASKSVSELGSKIKDTGANAGSAVSPLKLYTDAINDIPTIIAKIPRNVNVEFKANTSAANQAVKEFMAKASEANKTITTNFSANVAGAEKLAIIARIQALQALVEVGSQQLKKDNLTAEGRRTLGAGLVSAGREIATLQASLRGLATGGYVTGPGTGTSDSIPAMLSNGEYVIQASAVQTYGVDFLNALNARRVGASTPMPVASSSAGSGIVYLSPEDRALLRSAIDRPVNLYADSSKIASTAAAGNTVIAQRGLR